MSATVNIAELSPETPNVPTGTFDDAVKRLAALQQEIKVHSKAWTGKKLEAGKILLDLRKAAPHGTWERQLKTIINATKQLGGPMSQTTARRYMDLAEDKAVKADTKHSKNGYPLDELRSYLHKALRRADEDAAMRCMVELSVSGKDESTWRLLKDVFPSEDVGLARIGLIRELNDLYKSWKRTKNDLRFHAYRLPITHAILLLCRVEKSRLVDDALGHYFNTQQPIVIPEDCQQEAATAFENSPKIEVPDYAKDRHTATGRKMGRKGSAGSKHFAAEGAVLVNETTQPELQNNYRESARQASLKKVGAA